MRPGGSGTAYCALQRRIIEFSSLVITIMNLAMKLDYSSCDVRLYSNFQNEFTALFRG